MGYNNWITLALVAYLGVVVIQAAPVHIPEYVHKTVYNMSDPDNLLGTNTNLHCKLHPVDTSVHGLVTDILSRQAKLIDYDLIIVGNYSSNPLLVNQTWSYKSNMWARVGSSHGQTILNLAFNYGILSLMTLTFGLEKLQIELQESPAGCLGKMSEDQRIQAVVDILMRDLKDDGPVNVFEGESSICHQVIKEENGMAKFTDRCCFQARDGKDIVCVIDIPNRWLHILDILLAVLTFCVFLFGPALVPDWLYTAALDKLEYYVKLKEPLYKTLVVSHREIAPDITATHTIDLRNRKDFQRCRRILGELPSDTVIPIKISQFDINVTYRKLLLENKVPVGIISSLSRAIFLCKIKELEPFKDCCEARVCGQCPCSNKPWKSVCSFFGRVLLVFFLPLAFYIRLVVYYMFEHPEIEQRLEAASNLDLNVYYNYRLMQYLTPTHPMYLSVYIIYFVAGITMAYLSGKDNRTHFQQGIMDAFRDMKNLSMLNALGMVVVNCLWPFKTFGIFGIFVGVILWPFLMPLSIVACVVYCIPLVFLTIRILYHTFKSSPEEDPESDLNQSLGHMHADRLLKKMASKSNLKKAKEGLCYSNIRLQRFIVNTILTTTALFTLYAMMVMVAEVTGFLAEVMCFTMMGLIVNAAKVLKYGSLLFLVIIYSYDCYNNVNMKYLKLNKALFSEVRNRLGRDIEEFTQLPEDLQENRGFKACEASQQAEYESIDDISAKLSYHWDINDMILFVDKHDTPRIPKKLFDDVCAINVAGSPGPVYKSLLEATGKFMVIILFLVFVFIVVMSFGESYKISSTNQMLATMAGGFMPFIFSNILKPSAPEVETNLLSFRSKVEEIVKNFWQPWPMYDLIFDIEKEPESEESEEEEEEETEEDFDDALSEARTEVTVLTDKTGKTDQTERTVKSEKSDKSDKSEDKKDKKDKDKDKKDKGKDKDKKGDKKDKDKDKDKKPNGLGSFMKTTKIESRVVKQQVEEHDSLFMPAENQKVDILLYMSESDQEWQLEWSSVSNLDKSEYNGGLDLVRVI